jgi:hypothetical protein
MNIIDASSETEVTGLSCGSWHYGVASGCHGQQLPEPAA